MHVLVHYGEIGTKGRNRLLFEKQLVNNIKRKLHLNSLRYKVIRRHGYIEIPDIKQQDRDIITNILYTTFGIEYYVFADKVEYEEDNLIDRIVNAVRVKITGRFKVSTKRVYKGIKYTSPEINQQVGKRLEKEGYTVDYRSPDIVVYIEIHRSFFYTFTEKLRGPGGLPVGVSGNVVVLLSGGIDSPVAAWMMMKRGCRVVLLHYYNTPKPHPKIYDLVQKLREYDPDLLFIPVNILNLQDEIIMYTPPKYRMVVYRRYMLRIAEHLVRTSKSNEKKPNKHNTDPILAIVTGDSVGQVASQTLYNMDVITRAVNTLVLRPLVGLDKREIVELAKSIGTYDISIIPSPECCTYMIDKHPITHAKLEEVLKLEEKIDEKVVEEVFKTAEDEFYRIIPQPLSHEQDKPTQPV